jgi:hypothetical protein
MNVIWGCARKHRLKPWLAQRLATLANYMGVDPGTRASAHRYNAAVAEHVMRTTPPGCDRAGAPMDNKVPSRHNLHKQEEMRERRHAGLHECCERAQAV